MPNHPPNHQKESDPALAHEDEDSDDIPSNLSTAPPLSALIDMRLGRRATLKGLAAFTTLAGFGAPLFASAGGAQAAPSSLTFGEIPHGVGKGVRIAPGYSAQVLIRWGDKVTADAPGFDVDNQTAAAQEKQFGYNNDFTAYMPLPRGSANSRNGLLCVNHETTTRHLMWPAEKGKGSSGGITRDQVRMEMAAHGHSIVEIRNAGGGWRVAGTGRYNRRITALGTPMRLSGPAAGHERMKTRVDPTGRRVIGTLNNCAGGTTPWNTVLIAEENFHDYFLGDPETTPEARNHKRYGLGKGRARWAWGEYVDRFNVEKEPNEPNRFGWIVEIDPYDPASTPVKRTALGRFKHEGATTVINPGGHISVYCGDDQRFDYLYRFVTDRAYDPATPATNRDLLDSGTLYAARFDADGTMTWLPLVFGNGPLTPANGFHGQADVLIETRRSADLLGATPMDRPEDVETNPVNGRTYVICTNNTNRGRSRTNPANPRARNRHGHIIELIPPVADGQADHTARTYRWEFFLLAGDPAKPRDHAMYLADISANGWLSAPDNCTFDARGRIWVATDGQPKSGFADSVYAADTAGPGRGLTRCFFNAPRGAEICGPAFTPDDRTLFLSIQHPGAGSTFDDPSTRWPDFRPGMPPRPSVIAITRDDGGVIGS